MDKAEFEARLLPGFEAERRRHLEIERAGLAVQFLGGEIAPRLLVAVERDHLDPQDWLARDIRQPGTAAKAQPIAPAGQPPIRPEQKRPGAFVAANRNRTVGFVRPNRGFFQPVQDPPFAGRRAAFGAHPTRYRIGGYRDLGDTVHHWSVGGAARRPICRRRGRSARRDDPTTD